MSHAFVPSLPRLTSAGSSEFLPSRDAYRRSIAIQFSGLNMPPLDHAEPAEIPHPKGGSGRLIHATDIAVTTRRRAVSRRFRH